MAPISELVLRAYICSYIYSLIRLATLILKKVIFLKCYLFYCLQQALVKLGHYVTKSINQIGKSNFPQKFYLYLFQCMRDEKNEDSSFKSF